MVNTPKPSRSQNTSAVKKIVVSSFLICVAAAYGANVWMAQCSKRTVGVLPSSKMPPQSVVSFFSSRLFANLRCCSMSQFIDPRSFAVLGDNATFRENSFSTTFNPTSTPPPYFQIFDEAFLSILGPKPSIREVASNSTFAFAHEAPVFVPATDEVFFASNGGGPLGLSDLDNNNVVGKISLKDVDAAFAANETAVNVPVTFVSICLCWSTLG